MEETSLTDFEDGEDGDEQAPDPAEPTARFVSGGEECQACGATVERLWTDDGSQVCPSCKTW
jgi:formamidopyrimidine-DNA glycosylase